MSDTSSNDTALISWGWMLAIGIILVIGGIMCLSMPLVASLTVEAFAATAFLVVGIIQIWAAFKGAEGDGFDRLLGGLLGAVLLFFALSLFANPLKGLVSLTMMVAILFIATGILRAVIAFKMRDVQGWVWLALSGAVSVILGVIVFANLPAAALSLLGILLGIDLISSGVTTVIVALALRKA